MLPTFRCWLLVITIMSLLVLVKSKELVIFAGPHKTSETSIEKFFYTFANGQNNNKDDVDDESSTKNEKNPLDGWLWPRLEVEEDQELPHKVFSHLINDLSDPDKHEMIDNVLESIQDAWTAGDSSSNGLILGNEDFDHVGNAYTEADSVNAIEIIVEKLHRYPDYKHHVTMVLLYKAPSRLEQWLSIFKGIYLQDHDTQDIDNDDPYRDFVCQDNPEVLEAIHNQMNPLKLAKTFLDYYWNVALIDLGGVQKANLDVEHVIGCEILHGDCSDNGDGALFLNGLQGESFDKETEQYDEVQVEELSNVLTKAEEEELERLFRMRDCAYKKLFAPNDGTYQPPRYSSDHFQVLYQDTLWNDCEAVINNDTIANTLMDEDYVLNAIRYQKGCNNTPVVSIEEMLMMIPAGKESEDDNGEVSWDGNDDEEEGQNIFKEYTTGRRKKGLILCSIGVVGAALIGRFFYRRTERFTYHRYGGMPVVETGYHGRRPIEELIM